MEILENIDIRDSDRLSGLNRAIDAYLSDEVRFVVEQHLSNARTGP